MSESDIFDDIGGNPTATPELSSWQHDPNAHEIKDFYALPVNEEIFSLKINDTENYARILFDQSPKEFAATLNTYRLGELNPEKSSDAVKAQIEQMNTDKNLSPEDLFAVAKLRYGIREHVETIGDKSTIVQLINVPPATANPSKQSAFGTNEISKDALAVSKNEIADLANSLQGFLEQKHDGSGTFSAHEIQQDLIAAFEKNHIVLPEIRTKAKDEITDLFDHVNTISKAARYSTIRQDGKALSEVNSFYRVDEIVEKVKEKYANQFESMKQTKIEPVVATQKIIEEQSPPTRAFTLPEKNTLKQTRLQFVQTSKPKSSETIEKSLDFTDYIETLVTDINPFVEKTTKSIASELNKNSVATKDKPVDTLSDEAITKGAIQKTLDTGYLLDLSANKELVEAMKPKYEDIQKLATPLLSNKSRTENLSKLKVNENVLVNYIYKESLKNGMEHKPLELWGALFRNRQDNALYKHYELDSTCTCIEYVASEKDFINARGNATVSGNQLGIYQKPKDTVKGFVPILEVEKLYDLANQSKDVRKEIVWNENSEQNFENIQKAYKEEISNLQEHEAKLIDNNAKSKDLRKVEKNINKLVKEEQELELGKEALRLLSNYDQLEEYLNFQALTHSKI